MVIEVIEKLRAVLTTPGPDLALEQRAYEEVIAEYQKRVTPTGVENYPLVNKLQEVVDDGQRALMIQFGNALTKGEQIIPDQFVEKFLNLSAEEQSQ